MRNSVSVNHDERIYDKIKINDKVAVRRRKPLGIGSVVKNIMKIESDVSVIIGKIVYMES